jgi:hypothetical protein
VGWLIVLGLLVVGASALLSDLRLHDTAATCAGLRAPDASKPERRPELVTIHHQQPGDVLRPAVPPSRPVPGRGRPRTQVERGSLGSGRPPTPFQPAAPSDRGAGSDLAPSQLSAAQWAALRQLADAPDAVVACWPVGRAIAQALVRRGLVHACSEWVWLTEAGRQALDATDAHQPVHAHHTQSADATTEQAARSTPLPAYIGRRTQPTRPVRSGAGSDLPPGVLLRAARARQPSRS